MIVNDENVVVKPMNDSLKDLTMFACPLLSPPVSCAVRVFGGSGSGCQDDHGAMKFSPPRAVILRFELKRLTASGGSLYSMEKT